MSQEGIEVPSWASSSPFVVAVSDDILNGRRRTFQRSLSDMAQGYESWRPWMRQPDAPWKPCWHRGACHNEFDAWHASAREVIGTASVFERLSYHLDTVFRVEPNMMIDRILITGCALFNKPHTDVVGSIPAGKQHHVVDILSSIIHDANVEDVGSIVPGPDLLEPRLRSHFHPFMFESVDRVEQHLGSQLGKDSRLLGHVHARSDDEVALALESSAACMMDIVRMISETSGIPVRTCSWTECVGPYLDRAHALALVHTAEAQEIYTERVRTRPSYASLHAFDPARGMERTIANNILYAAEAMYLKDHPTTAIVNCEFADTFWRGLEDLFAVEVWGTWRPFIGMVAQKARQPWGY
jgi:hypothetical protein